MLYVSSILLISTYVIAHISISTFLEFHNDILKIKQMAGNCLKINALIEGTVRSEHTHREHVRTAARSPVCLTITNGCALECVE